MPASTPDSFRLPKERCSRRWLGCRGALWWPRAPPTMPAERDLRPEFPHLRLCWGARGMAVCPNLIWSTPLLFQVRSIRFVGATFLGCEQPMRWLARRRVSALVAFDAARCSGRSATGPGACPSASPSRCVHMGGAYNWWRAERGAWSSGQCFICEGAFHHQGPEYSFEAAAAGCPPNRRGVPNPEQIPSP